MDWSKAKNVMIIALLITNAFLLYLFLDKNYEKVETASETSIKRVLSEHDISLKTKIPEVRTKLPVLSLSYTSPNGEIVEEKLKNRSFKLSESAGTQQYEKISNLFMEKMGFLLTDFVVGDISRDEEKVTVPYFSVYDGYIIDDEPLYVMFEKGELVGLKGKLTIGMPAVKKQIPVMSAKEALLLFMSEQAGKENKITINEIKMVFWVNGDVLTEENLVLDTAFPAWRITYNGDNIKYILANRG